MPTQPVSPLFKRIESEINNYISGTIEISEGVHFSQYKTIQRIYKFKNRDLTEGNKLKEDLSYDYYFDIISPRVDSEVKNLRFDTKHILVFSENPTKDYPAVFISNAMLKNWMAENGEDEKLKAAVEEFTENGNVGFKKVDGGYEIIDALNTYITNVQAQSVDDTDIIERHELTASQIKRMESWDQDKAQKVIKELGNKTFSASEQTDPIESTNKRYEIFEYSGEVSELEFNQLKGKNEGDEHKYFLAKIIVAGLRKSGAGEKYTLFAEKLDGKLSDHYIYAHRGSYKGRFWRVGMYEMLIDHQVRANEIGNDLASGLGWASKVFFKSSDSGVLQNIRADMENGDVIIAKDIDQLNVRMQGMDQLIADWNRLMQDADRLSNSLEVVRGESMPSGTPFRMGMLLDQNAGRLFVLLRQKITLPYKRVFREWVLPQLVDELSGEQIFTLTGETEAQEQLRKMLVESWYAQNLAKIGNHTAEIAETIKAEQLEQLQEVEPVIKNVKEIWKGIKPRIFVTITGENSDMADNVQDIVSLLQLEKDPERISFLLDSLYKIRGIPVPPKSEPQQTQLSQGLDTQIGPGLEQGEAAAQPVVA